MMTTKLYAIITLLFLTITVASFAQEQDSIQLKELKHSIDLSPISPFINIYGIHYNYHFNPKDELILGLAYMNIQYEFGNTNSPSLVIGYRRYLWRNLHIEYEVWPSYDNFYEKNEQKYYKSFDVWNEFRLGYQFNFKIAEIPLYTSIQWPFGFGLYASNKPLSFKEYQKDNRFFYQFPLLFVGVKF
jgi:hypothetical protein